MEIRIKAEGSFPWQVRVLIPREELLQKAILSFPYFDALNRGTGVVRYRGQQVRRKTWEEVSKYKVFLEEHLRFHGLIGPDGKPRRRFIALGARDLANNLGYLAFLKGKGLFYLQDEPKLGISSYTCFFWGPNGFGIDDFSVDFEGGRISRQGETQESYDFVVSGLPLVKNGEPVDIQREEFLRKCTDIRHIFRLTPQEEEDLFQGYPDDMEGFLERLSELFARGPTRAWYVHSGVGITERGDLLILQAPGTLEEVAELAKGGGAQDFIVLDNGGSCFLYAPLNPDSTTFLNQSPKWRRPTVALLAFLLHGELPSNHDGYIEGVRRRYAGDRG